MSPDIGIYPLYIKTADVPLSLVHVPLKLVLLISPNIDKRILHISTDNDPKHYKCHPNVTTCPPHIGSADVPLSLVHVPLRISTADK